jgi:hypothetical protein
MEIAKILVRLKILSGLEESISIQHQGYTFSQELDYKGIPFRCSPCHIYGHLEKECALPEKRRKWFKNMIPAKSVDPPPLPPSLTPPTRTLDIATTQA